MDTILLTLMVGLIGAGVGISIRMALRGPRVTGYLCLALVAWPATVGIFLVKSGYASCLSIVISTVISLAGLLIYRRIWRRNLTQLIVDAPALMTFALGRFAELDTDGDGNITRLDIWDAQRKQSFSPAEQYLLKQLDSYIWMVGHVVHSTRTVSPMSGTVVYLHTYGASRNDLSDWSLRTLDTYERDFSF